MNEKEILIKALFDELYAIMNQQGAHPDKSCAAIQTDLLSIISGKLSSSERPFMERFQEQLDWIKFDYEVLQLHDNS